MGDIIDPSAKGPERQGRWNPSRKKGDMEWQEEESSEGAPSQARAKKRATPKAAGSMIELSQSLKRLLEQDFNKRMESMKAELQLEFTKLSDRMAEEVTKATAQMAQELSRSRIAGHKTQELSS
ncbi:hypothetical protein ACJZ2D_017102 [Fusarium nematophilum]